MHGNIGNSFITTISGRFTRHILTTELTIDHIIPDHANFSFHY